MPHTKPIIGCWYKDRRGLIFEVVAYDDHFNTIEMQYIDGEITEYELESWHQLFLQTIEEPEDWRNPFELNHEDYIANNDVIVPEDWHNPLDFIESDVIHGLVDEFF